jgi:hypothetical protein
MRLRLLAFVSSLVLCLAGLHCGSSSSGGGGTIPPGGGEGGADAGSSDAEIDRPPPITTTDKIDLLLVVDDSSSMADKSALLAPSVASMVKRLVAPNCLGPDGKSAGASSGGACPAGSTIEFAPVRDLHVGIITSSLGTFGGDVCPDSGNFNRLAHLQTTGPGGTPTSAATRGFLAYGPGGTTDADALASDAAAIVNGVGQAGCGFEAQLEAAYRFLVQPDPWQKVALSGSNQAELSGIDVTLLQQRAAFLRPDSLVSIVLLTDEDDSAVDPRSVGGQGWAFENTQFPGSTIFRSDGKTTTAPRATSECATNPGSADCTSCGFAATCDPSDPACQRLKSDPECQKNGGYYGPTEDQLNVRFHRMKERFGIDPQFPIKRYVDGFTSPRVPDQDGEHAVNGNLIGPYLGDQRCTNPLFAASLPTGPGDELCNLPFSGRRQDLVLFGLIGGVPRQLVDGGPQWTPILGAHPDDFDFTGIDAHMIPSETPRPGLPPPSATVGDDGTDPIHGREWDTQNDDLQYACTFDLPAPKTCTASDPSCDCSGTRNPPLCSATPNTQTKGKAYPTVRELRVAQALGDRAVVASICALDATQAYKPALDALVDKMRPHLLQ